MCRSRNHRPGAFAAVGQLEADAVVTRTVLPEETPVRVEYALTEDGHALSGVMDQLEAWGIEYLARGTGREPAAT